MFIVVFSSRQPKVKKRNSEKHTEYFWSFVFLEESKLKEGKKNKNEKNFLHGKAPNKQKKKREIFLGFLLILQLIKQERKPKRREKYFWIFSKKLKDTKAKRKIKTNVDYTMKEDEHCQLE